MRRDPLAFPKLILGLKLPSGQLVQYAFIKRGEYTSAGHKLRFGRRGLRTMPMISTLEFYLQQGAQQDA